MSLANGFNRIEGDGVAIARRCLANVRTALLMLTRPARLRAAWPWMSTPRQVAIAAGIGIAVLLILMVASLLVFVIACSNVANLILARTVRRAFRAMPPTASSAVAISTTTTMVAAKNTASTAAITALPP